MLICRIWYFQFKRCERNLGNPSEKNDPSCLGFQGHSRLSEPTQVDQRAMTSHDSFVAAIGLFRTVSEINGDFRWKSQFYQPRVFYAEMWHWVKALGLEQQKYWATSTRPRKKFEKVFSHFDTIHERVKETESRQSDGHRWTASAALTHSVPR